MRDGRKGLLAQPAGNPCADGRRLTRAEAASPALAWAPPGTATQSCRTKIRIACDHERKQNPERNRDLAQNPPDAALARHVAQRVDEDRDVAEQIRDEDQQDP